MKDEKNNKNTEYSVRKVDIQAAIRNKKPFSVLPNEVLQNLRDPLALAVWCYLQSLPPDWKIIKSQVRDHFSLGEKKCKSIFSLLHELKLIEYTRLRNADGTLGAVDIVINDGFDLQSSDTTGAKTSPVVTTGAILHPVVNHTCGKDGTTNINIYTNTNINTNTDGFERFWNAYPRKTAKKPAQQKWKTLKLDDHIEVILEKLKLQKENDWKGKDLQYIPHAQTYLNQARWQDEIEPSQEERLRQEKLKRQLENAERQAQQEKASQLRLEQERNKHLQHSKDGQIYRAIAKEVKNGNVSKPSAEFRELAKKLGVK